MLVFYYFYDFLANKNPLPVKVKGPVLIGRGEPIKPWGIIFGLVPDYQDNKPSRLELLPEQTKQFGRDG